MLPTQVTLIKLTLHPIIPLVQSEKKNKCFLMSSAAFLSLFVPAKCNSAPCHSSPSLPSFLSIYRYTERRWREGKRREKEGRERGGGQGRRWWRREIILRHSILFVHNNFSPKVFIVQKFPLLKLEFFAFSRRRNFNSFLQLFFPYSLYAYSSIPKDILKSPKQILEKKWALLLHEWGNSYNFKNH